MYQLDMEATRQSETSLSEDPQEQADSINRRNDRIRKRFDKFKFEFLTCYDSGELVSKSI